MCRRNLDSQNLSLPEYKNVYKLDIPPKVELPFTHLTGDPTDNGKTKNTNLVIFESRNGSSEGKGPYYSGEKSVPISYGV